ncbi:GH36 C-terminal domain-containing protein [Kocuria coralli]|uniref:GH36 C-terminal domain-containing protein n=1 Tax=Kocuria coralli TaxID=1461025 RepID=UPI001FE63BF6|nr:GH36 C-terminal domain-containing protein [Kocuria coralli]
MIRLDQVDPEWDVHGVVSPSGDEALFAVVCLGVSIIDPVGRLTLAGLDPELSYSVEDITPEAADAGFRPPAWWPGGERLRGSVLQESGIHAPDLRPDRIRLLHLTSRA